MGEFHYFPRAAYRGDPAGMTVSKKAKLPSGDFGITEYINGDMTLWFVDRDRFTESERMAAFHEKSYGFSSLINNRR